MKRFVRKLLGYAVVVAVGGAVALWAQGHLPLPQLSLGQAHSEPKVQTKAIIPLPVTVNRVAVAEFVETVLVTGSLIPREEILVGPEIEGLRVLEVLVDEGDRVKKGQVLARLVNDTLDAQLAQNDANLARSAATIAQAESTITQAEARLEEARNAHERGKPLRQSGYIAESVMDQREAAAKTSEALLASARDGLKVAQAERGQIEAQRRELAWRRAKTDITAPADGLISRRTAKIGATAALASVEPLFRIVAAGEIELDAEVIETRLAKLRPDQPARIDAAGAGEVGGKVRLVSAEVDKATRLGRVRVFLGDSPALRVGAFARGTIETARSSGLAVPAAAVLYGEQSASVQLVVDGKVATRAVKLGLAVGGLVEIREGLAEGEVVVAKSGTFLREGDSVKPVLDGSGKLSEAR
jgi:RND family efflux transporter MFP subunit